MTAETQLPLPLDIRHNNQYLFSDHYLNILLPNDSRPEYSRLTHQLESTNRLIDRIMYQLYGLADEEIAIVEGRGE